MFELTEGSLQVIWVSAFYINAIEVTLSADATGFGREFLRSNQIPDVQRPSFVP
jgi:hypothetical protein